MKIPEKIHYTLPSTYLIEDEAMIHLNIQTNERINAMIDYLNDKFPEDK